MDVKDLVAMLRKQMNEAPEKPRPILVIAGSWHEYLWWCDKHHEPPRNGRARYIGDVYRLYGMEAKRCDLVFTGTPYERDDWDDILGHLRICGWSEKEIYAKMFGRP